MTQLHALIERLKTIESTFTNPQIKMGIGIAIGEAESSLKEVLASKGGVLNNDTVVQYPIPKLSIDAQVDDVLKGYGIGRVGALNSVGAYEYFFSASVKIDGIFFSSMSHNEDDAIEGLRIKVRKYLESRAK